MTDEDALIAAVAAAPDDDLPRLVFADWLDDDGQPDRAEFVRAQVRFSASQPWEPFAVLCRHRRPEWVHGKPWRNTLPRVDGKALEWHPERAFRRGFGYSLIVRDVRWLLSEAPRLFAEAPVGELHLPTATLDEWREFARVPWLPRVKSVHFFGTTTPNEPVQVMCESPLSTGIEEIVFEKSSGAGMPELIGGLLETPLGKQIMRLTLKAGPLGMEGTEQIVDAMRDSGPAAKPTSISLMNYRISALTSDRLVNSRRTENLLEFNATDVANATSIVRAFATGDRNRPLSILRINRSDYGGVPDLSQIASSENLPNLRLLDVGDQIPGRNLPEPVAWAESLSVLRSVGLRKCGFADDSAAVLVRCRFWPNLVELDLRDNRFTDAGAAHLLAAHVPPDLTALLLAGNPISDGMRNRLRGHFGEALIV